MSIHRIRLGPPWDVSPDGVRHVRRFGRPRTLDADEHVWLAGQFPQGAMVTVNGQHIDSIADITTLLQPRNELVVQLASAEHIGEVTLEIRSGAKDSDYQQNPSEPGTTAET